MTYDEAFGRDPSSPHEAPSLDWYFGEASATRRFPRAEDSPWCQSGREREASTGGTLAAGKAMVERVDHLGLSLPATGCHA